MAKRYSACCPQCPNLEFPKQWKEDAEEIARMHNRNTGHDAYSGEDIN